MKTPFIAALLPGLLVTTLAGTAFAQGTADEPEARIMNRRAPGAGAEAGRQRLRVSAGPDPDTVYVGFSQSDHWNATTNYWNIWSGTRRPGTNNPDNAMWGWDDLHILASHGVGDSLAGWWPDLQLYSTTGSVTLPDHQRPWWAIEHGNRANYVINQGPGGRRTYGVVGVWHGDGGALQPGGSGVTWTPLSGSRSAWCGLRQLNDHSVLDAVTGNPFNQSVVERSYVGGGPGSRRYPGYASQWDQLLYRDVVAPAGQPLNVTFLYRTRMSTSAVTAAATRTGWFHGDPLAVVAGNFVSSTAAGANAPVDSFSVYAGAPVDEGSCTYSDGSIGVVYDVQRRWFSEVLRLFDGSPYHCLFSVAGNHPADTADATPLAQLTLAAEQVDAIRDAPGNTAGIVRLVFRSHTNRGYSDDDGLGGYDSATRGAVMIDDVTVNGSVIGDFEGPDQGGPNTIDNRTGASPLLHWKSTGRPPSVYAHLGNVEAGIPYADICGAWDSPQRYCDIRGNVLMMGNYDAFEAMNDPRVEAYREGFPGAWSPTINMAVARDGSNAVNPHGLTESIVTTSGANSGIHLLCDIYAGQTGWLFTGTALWIAAQAYPVRQPDNGSLVWSDLLRLGYVHGSYAPICFPSWYNLEQELATWPTFANAYDRPESLRVWVGAYQACFRWSVSLGCNADDGIYYDNVSVAFVDNAGLQASGTGAIDPGSIEAHLFGMPADVFPANETAGLPASALFDTTTALIRGPGNVAPNTNNELRFCIQPDTVVVDAADVRGDEALGNATRLDLVFRILPGPGNYAIASPGGRTFPPTAEMRLLDVPTDQSNFVSSGDGTFWGEYMADPGAFSKGDHHGSAWWDHLTWNSARCDTAERNVFPVSTAGGLGIGTGLAAGKYANMLHEDDPKFATLGISKFRCFVVDTAAPAQNANIACDGSVPVWLGAVPQSRTGWDGVTTTREFTKIIPDGMLTPGAHVQYFFRKSALADPDASVIVPDTLTTFDWGAYRDAARWHQFGVLPDRWKDAAFGGSGMACMLYVDQCDGIGGEPVFVSVMDSLGGTSPAKYGAHNGWHAPALPGPLVIEDLAAHPVHGKNQQPGSTWDMYGVRVTGTIGGWAVDLGARLANRAAMGYAAGKQARTAPTPEMLRRFYRLTAIVTGWLGVGIMGPYQNVSQDDIGMLDDFLTGNDLGSTPQPRGIFVSGEAFVEGEVLTSGQNPAHSAFLASKLGLTFRSGSYMTVSNLQGDCAELLTTAHITPNGDLYGVANGCLYANDVLLNNPTVPEAVPAAYYGNVGVNGPYVAAVYKPATPERNWVAYTEGWDMAALWSRYCETSGGRLAYYWSMYNSIFATQCQVTTTSPSQTLDVPQSSRGGPFTDFMKVGNSLARGENARVRFGVSRADRVRIGIFDVAGRRVRTLADRTFAPGEYDLAWDGADDLGYAVARGVYFVRLEYATRGAATAGRIVFLRQRGQCGRGAGGASPPPLAAPAPSALVSGRHDGSYERRDASLPRAVPVGRGHLGAPGRGRQHAQRLVALRARRRDHPRRRRQRRRLPALRALRRGLHARRGRRPQRPPAVVRVEPPRAAAGPPRPGGGGALPRRARLAAPPRTLAGRDASPLHEPAVDRRRGRLGVGGDGRGVRTLRALLRARVRRRGGLVVHGQRARGVRVPRLVGGHLAAGRARQLARAGGDREPARGARPRLPRDPRRGPHRRRRRRARRPGRVREALRAARAAARLAPARPAAGALREPRFQRRRAACGGGRRRGPLDSRRYPGAPRRAGPEGRARLDRAQLLHALAGALALARPARRRRGRAAQRPRLGSLARGLRAGDRRLRRRNRTSRAGHRERLRRRARRVPAGGDRGLRRGHAPRHGRRGSRARLPALVAARQFRVGRRLPRPLRALLGGLRRRRAAPTPHAQRRGARAHRPRERARPRRARGGGSLKDSGRSRTRPDSC